MSAPAVSEQPVRDTVVAARAAVKRFGGNLAVDRVSVEIARGEVHAFVGENGAGKSTLAKMIAGVHQPDEGEVVVDGEVRHFGGPHDAYQAGVSMVHQELSVIGSLSVAENVMFGIEPSRLGAVRRGALAREARRYLEVVGLDVSPGASAADLSPAKQQLLEVAHVLALQSRVIIFDEPTSALTTSDAEHLLDLVRRLRDEGRTVILISHDFDEVLGVADRVTCLRDGRLVSTRPAAELDDDQLIAMVTGRQRDSTYGAHTPVRGERVVLGVKGLAAPGVRDASLLVRAGEIVGIGGLVGSGRSELLMAMFGAGGLEAGEMLLDGRPYRPRSPADAIAAGIGLVPESRKEQGLILGASVRDNIELAALDRLSTGPWTRPAEARRLAEESVERFGIKLADLDAPVSSLSGGNQQKVVLAKVLATNPSILLLDEPTKGIDVGAKAEIHRIIRELAHAGIAVVMVTSVLPELLAGSDRVVVMRGGRTVGELHPETAGEEDVARLAFAG